VYEKRIPYIRKYSLALQADRIILLIPFHAPSIYSIVIVECNLPRRGQGLQNFYGNRTTILMFQSEEYYEMCGPIFGSTNTGQARISLEIEQLAGEKPLGLVIYSYFLDADGKLGFLSSKSGMVSMTRHSTV
jgi:hypothetical protein